MMPTNYPIVKTYDITQCLDCGETIKYYYTRTQTTQSLCQNCKLERLYSTLIQQITELQTKFAELDNIQQKMILLLEKSITPKQSE